MTFNMPACPNGINMLQYQGERIMESLKQYHIIPNGINDYFYFDGKEFHYEGPSENGKQILAYIAGWRDRNEQQLCT